jgi:hypothetical protein
LSIAVCTALTYKIVLGVCKAPANDNAPILKTREGLKIFRSQFNIARLIVEKWLASGTLTQSDSKQMTSINLLMFGPPHVALMDQTKNDLDSFLRAINSHGIEAIVLNNRALRSKTRNGPNLPQIDMFLARLNNNDQINLIIHDEAHFAIGSGGCINTFYTALRDRLRVLPHCKIAILLVSATLNVLLKPVASLQDSSRCVDWNLMRLQQLYQAPTYRSIRELEFYVDREMAGFTRMSDASEHVCRQYIDAVNQLNNFASVQSQTVSYKILEAIKSSRVPIMAVIRLYNSNQTSNAVQRDNECSAQDEPIVVGEAETDALPQQDNEVSSEEETDEVVIASGEALHAALRELATMVKTYIILDKHGAASINQQLQEQGYHGDVISNASQLDKLNVICIVIERLRMGERIPNTCLHYDVRSRYLSNGISSLATFVQDVGRCAGHGKPRATIYTAVDHLIPANINNFDTLLRGGINTPRPTRVHPEFEDGVYSDLEPHIVVLDAEPQIGKTGALLSVIGIMHRIFMRDAPTFE